jgi:hypothetical protein
VIRARIDELTAPFELQDILVKRVGRMSTGMKQRLSIARVIFHDPQVLIFDEPTAGLDVIGARTVLDLVLDLKKRGRTIIFSTHIMTEAERICDEIAVIESGDILAQGTLDAIKGPGGFASLEGVYRHRAAGRRRSGRRERGPHRRSADAGGSALMTGKILSVYRKELIDTLRDGRSIFAIFIFPFIMYPAMLFFTSWMANKDDQAEKLVQVRVGVVGASAVPFVMDSLAAVPGVTPVALAAAPASMEEAGVNAVLVIPEGVHESLARGDSVRVDLLYKRADNTSSAAADRVEPVLDRVRQALTVSWATSHGAHADAPPPLAVDEKDISLKSDMGRYIAALVIPYLLIFMVAAGSMQTAIDCTTGEKERSTLETILATSASRSEIVLGKCMAVLTAALTGATTGIFGLWFTFAVIARRLR